MFPEFVRRFILLTIYFTSFGLVYEFVGLKLDYWEFPGDSFVGIINIMGNQVPVEEILYFVMFAASGLLVYYEIFIDDRR